MRIQYRFLALWLVSVLFVTPLTTNAADPLPAGFAPSSLWLSQSAPVAGSGVRLYAVVYNSTSEALEGSLTFQVDDASVGAVPFSLEAGESSIKSLLWTPTEGTHKISAIITSTIDKKTKETRSVKETATAVVSVTVAPEPPKPPIAEAMDSAQTIASTSSPIVSTIISATTGATESIRKAGEDYLAILAGEKSATASSSQKSGSVLGAATETPEEETASSTASFGYAKSIAKALLPIFRSPGLFYLVFISLILAVFWLIMRRLRNPRRRK